MSGKGIELVVFDMEGTLTCNPTVWELMHVRVGTWESHGLRYWERYKAGELEYDEFARLDVSTWKNAPTHWLDRAVEEVPLMAGCHELMGFLNRRGIRTAIVSNGLERLALRLAREFDMTRVLANREVIDRDGLTGELDLRVPFAGKGEALSRIASDLGVPERQVMAVGDGPADIEMFRRAGLGVAFAPSHPSVALAAQHHIAEPDLRRVMTLLE